MRFTFTAEQDELRRELRRFLAARSPVDEVRRLMATDEGYDPAVWRQLAGQLGLQGLAIPERFGGAGFGPVEQLVVLEEAGRALLCAPYLASAVLAANALLASGDEAAQADLLPGIADGTTIATLAPPAADGDWSAAAPAVTAAGSALTGHALTGHATTVLDGHVADLLLVVAGSPAGPSLYAVQGDAPGVSRRLLRTVDLTRKLAAVDLAGAPGRLVGTAGGAAGVVEAALRAAAAALAAEQVGGAQRCLDMAVEYAKLRVQFGRAIGSFQAVKHTCADVLLEVESARSAAYAAAWAAQDGDPDLPVVASMAKAFCSDVYVRAAAENIQLHGGIGFTWEHDAHLYYRRAQSSALMFGTPEQHRETVARHLLAAGEPR